MPRENKRKKPSLTVQITISLLIGIVAGIAMQSIPDIAEGYVKPFGTIYLNLIKMIVVPVVVLSIIQGIVSLQDVRKVGSIGIKTIAFYLVTTAIAVTLGLVAANLLQVGAGYTLGTEALTYEPAEPLNLMDTLVNIFPSNAFQPLADATMLQVIVIALFFGFGIIAVGEKGVPAKNVVDSFAEVCFKIMSMILKLSPIGVFALICPVVAANGPSGLRGLRGPHGAHLFPGSEGLCRSEPPAVFPGHERAHALCLLQRQQRGHASFQHGCHPTAGGTEGSLQLCAPPGRYHQHGRYRHLSGGLRHLHRPDFRH